MITKQEEVEKGVKFVCDAMFREITQGSRSTQANEKFQGFASRYADKEEHEIKSGNKNASGSWDVSW